jgi:hypothetical protein
MALQFKIQIQGITKPPVWRQVIVPETFTFDQFHVVIQLAFGWEFGHLYQFSAKGWGDSPYISVPFENDDEPIIDSAKIKLKDVFKKENQTYMYIYDFGDSWEHKITLEKITDNKILHASCIGGKGACPPEDCGGIWGYEEIKTIFAKSPQSEEAEEYREWLGLDDDEVWDPAYFDKEEADEAVKEV